MENALPWDARSLDIVVGRIDAPAPWRLQFWVAPTFNRWCAAMIEGESNGGASAYFWLLSGAQANAMMDVYLGSSTEITGIYAEERAIELSREQTEFWHNWQFSRVGEIAEDVDTQMRDGTGVAIRFFDGVTSYYADATNPDPKQQPLRFQANEEIFQMLGQFFGWRALMEESNPFKKPKR